MFSGTWIIGCPYLNLCNSQREAHSDTTIFFMFQDQDEPLNSMMKHFPPKLVKPWKDSLSKLCCIDVKAKNVLIL